mgnify:CR=1 FL=1
MKKTVRHGLLTGVVLILLAAPAFARGQAEDPIRQARELVGENRINEAILLLEQTVRDDPERIQEAEALMRTIREIRGEYNVLFEQLIDNLVNNPDDIERTLEIIDRMEALDEFPNERVVQQVQDARIVAQLAFDRNLLNRRMDEARNLLAEDQYVAAIDVYLDLRTLQRDRFETRGYGDIFVNTVDQAVAQAQAVAQDFRSVLPPYQEAGEQILQRARQDVLLLDQEDLTPFFTEAERMASILERTDEVSQDFAVLKSQVALQFPDDPVDWYLNFQDIIARGRVDFRGDEGLLYAVQQGYQDTIGQLSEAGREQTNQLLELGRIAATADRHSTAEERFRTAVQTAALWEQAVTAQAGLFEPNPPLDRIQEETDPEQGSEVVLARATGTTVQSLSELSAALGPFVESGIDRSATLFSLESQIAAAESAVNTFQRGRDELLIALDPIDDLPTAFRSDALQGRIAATLDRWSTAIQRAMNRERTLAVAISETRTAGFGENLTGLAQEMTTLAPLNNGVEQAVGDDEAATQIVRFPDEALAGYQTVANTLTEIAQTVQFAQEELASENEYVLGDAAVQEEQARVAVLEQRVSTLQLRANAGITEAQDLIAQAEELQTEAQQRIADTRAAIAAFQVEAARNNYAAAREAYLQSLSLREDPALRSASDATIQEVGAELQELENVIVVRRVRELITQADELYNQDNYVASRDTLLAAQQTWEQTNVEPNAEVERLLRLVTAALSLEEGRELTMTDPLYPILGNYLSIAREDFNRGQRLYQAGNVAQADILFDRAIENLRNVRDVRPLNWDARILELRIAQIRNEDDFDQVFASRYRQAVGRLDEVGPLEVYSELEVLAEINPDYPGIQEQIRQLEIALNLRENPVDQARVREAAALYQRAEQLAGGSIDQATVAVSLLEQAVQLNPDNRNATFLLDQLRIRLGGQATVALSAADEQQYRRAETLFSQGQVLQALQIVERLLSNANNQNYPPLVDLRRRIALRLGI